MLTEKKNLLTLLTGQTFTKMHVCLLSDLWLQFRATEDALILHAHVHILQWIGLDWSNLVSPSYSLIHKKSKKFGPNRSNLFSSAFLFCSFNNCSFKSTWGPWVNNSYHCHSIQIKIHVSKSWKLCFWVHRQPQK